MTDKILCHFCPVNLKNSNFEKMEKKNTSRYYHLVICTVNDNHRMYGSWRYGTWQIDFFVSLNGFLPFYLPNNLKNKKFEKMKNTLRDIITLNMCAINDNHIMYGSRDVEWDRKFVVILCHILPFYLTNNLKNQGFEKIKKTSEILSFYTCVL